eukprot:4234352-Amphidinium_carterae.2
MDNLERSLTADQVANLPPIDPDAPLQLPNYGDEGKEIAAMEMPPTTATTPPDEEAEAGESHDDAMTVEKCHILSHRSAFQNAQQHA